MAFLNKDGQYFTSARNDGEGKPITDVQVRGSDMEHYGNSTSTKPTNSTVPVGATFFEIDTSTAYMNDGTNWVVI